MTTEEQLQAEVQRLRGELAEERAKVHELSSALAAAVSSAAHAQKIDAERRAARAAQNRRAYDRRQQSIQHAESGAATRADSPPPPLEGSPPPSIPSSPSPISSPPSLFSPTSSAAPQEELVLEPKKPPRRVKKPKPEKLVDPRHAPLTKELCEVNGWPHHGGRTAKAVSELLQLADSMPPSMKPPEGAPAEVLRRASIARAHDGFPRVRELHELVTHWGHFAEPQRRSTGPPDGLEAVPPDTCAGCGAQGQGGSVGDPDVWLGYECGCLGAWNRTQLEQNLHFTKAAEWAAQRRAA